MLKFMPGSIPDFIPGFNRIKYNSNLSGSTGAKLYKNKTTGKKWVVKQSEKGEGGAEQVVMESIVNDIYKALGIPVPKHKLRIIPFPTINKPDTVITSLVLEHIDGKLLKEASYAEYKKAKAELQKGFIVDALLANWDVIGLENIIIPNDGSAAVRIDNGGALIFRAHGAKKEFTDIVNEIDTMRNPDIAFDAYPIFRDLTTKEINEQIETIIKPNQQKILDLTPDALKPTMAKRINNLLERLAPEWTNKSPFKNTVKETATPKYIPAVQRALIKFFKDGWNTFKGLNTANVKVNIGNAVHGNAVHGNVNTSNQLLALINNTLKDNKAVISGGFILKAIGAFIDPKSVDIDIYVPTKNVATLKKVMEKLFKFENVDIRVAKPESKHTKDGILSVSKYSKGEPSAPGYAEMDIVEVNADKTPIDVIKNFDFTFCENWYDGTTVFMTYPEHVEKKAGFLEKHYMDLLYEGDSVLFKRMEKYIGRGFKISIDMNKIPKNITNSIKNGSFLEQLGSIKLSRAAEGVIVSTKYTPEIAEQIKDRIDKRRGNNGWNIPITNLAGITNLTLYTRSLPDMASELTPVDKAAINHYTEDGYIDINVFLYKNMIDKLDTRNTIFNWLKTKFSKANEETHIHYNTQLLYYYFVNLYNAIQKGPRVLYDLPPLYRGVKEWYLSTESDRYYYTNSFMSTSPILSRSFGKKLYAFYVHPQCRYLNIEKQSSRPDEHEVLLTPYHRYLYDTEEIRKPFIIRKYIVLPVDFDIPNEFEEYMVWKEDILLKSSIFKNQWGVPIGSAAMEGGRDPVVSNSHRKNFRISNNITQRKRQLAWINKKIETKNITNKKLKKVVSRNNNSRMRNNTRKLDTSTLSPRFTDPILSFPGNNPTPNELEVIKKMRQIIMNDKQMPKNVSQLIMNDKQMPKSVVANNMVVQNI